MFSGKPTLIGLCGGSSSGKSTISNKLNYYLGDCSQISLDNYFKVDPTYGGKTREEYLYEHNFDCLEAFNLELFLEHLRVLRAGKIVKMPIYDFSNSLIIGEKLVLPAKYILVDGILLFTTEELRKLLDIKLYIECNDLIRYNRRLKRDVFERGADETIINHQYKHFVAPMYEILIKPTRIYADIIFDNSELCSEHQLEVKINDLIETIQRKVRERQLLI